MYITILRLMQLSTSDNITSTPWYQQFYMSMLKHCGGGGGGGGGGAGEGWGWLIWRGNFTEGFLHYELLIMQKTLFEIAPPNWGAHDTWRGLFLEMHCSTLIQYKNVIILLYLEGGKGYFRDS